MNLKKFMLMTGAVVLGFRFSFALEKVKNDFWDTTGYSGVAPAVAATAALIDPIDSWAAFAISTDPLPSEFSSLPLGFLLLFK